MFQSYQFRQINPDVKIISKLTTPRVSIVSIQADQSRPFNQYFYQQLFETVSIVSIQADQSRRLPNGEYLIWDEDVSIVSIQADQSRP